MPTFFEAHDLSELGKCKFCDAKFIPADCVISSGPTSPKQAAKKPWRQFSGTGLLLIILAVIAGAFGRFLLRESNPIYWNAGMGSLIIAAILFVGWIIHGEMLKQRKR